MTTRISVYTSNVARPPSTLPGPSRPSYPELVPEALHHPLLHAPVLYSDEDELFRIMGDILSGEERPLPLETLRRIPERLDWRTQVSAYDDLLEEVAEGEQGWPAGAAWRRRLHGPATGSERRGRQLPDVNGGWVADVEGQVRLSGLSTCYRGWAVVTAA